MTKPMAKPIRTFIANPNFFFDIITLLLKYLILKIP
jgi:hypothetical protein